mgnify:FL=1
MAASELDSVVWEVVRRRRSTRAFRPDPVPTEALVAALEVMRWAPSAFNAQPWAVVLARRAEEREAYERLLAALQPGNARWAQAAPVLAAVVVYPWAPDNKPNRHAWFDVGGAWAWFTMAAVAHGLAVHAMAGFDPAAAAVAIELPKPWEPAVMAAIGYPGDPATLPEDLRARELGPQRQRKALREFVFLGRWGVPLPDRMTGLTDATAPQTPPATASP